MENWNNGIMKYCNCFIPSFQYSPPDRTVKVRLSVVRAGNIPDHKTFILHLRPRMERPMYFLQILSVDMRIDLCRRNIHMPQQFLDNTKIGPTLQQMRREGMTERMRMDVFLDAGLFGVFGDHLPDPFSSESRAPGIEEENIFGFAFAGQRYAGITSVFLYPFLR